MAERPHIRELLSADIPEIVAAFAKIGWNKPESQYRTYLTQQTADERLVLVARVSDEFAGYVTVVWETEYPPFRREGIPEIKDLNVLPSFQRRGIGSALMTEAEGAVARRSPTVGIGVGLYSDYGAAQRMYVKRGYVPDGEGVYYGARRVLPGEELPVDDSLILFLTLSACGGASGRTGGV
jgi:GNAT superfamily N-acetyltransferase